jgi:hypothetical protein
MEMFSKWCRSALKRTWILRSLAVIDGPITTILKIWGESQRFQNLGPFEGYHITLISQSPQLLGMIGTLQGTHNEQEMNRTKDAIRLSLPMPIYLRLIVSLIASRFRQLSLMSLLCGD